jgi:hypothetical protein
MGRSGNSIAGLPGPGQTDWDALRSFSPPSRLFTEHHS